MRTRETILLAAARAASLHGFEGVSIGALAKELGMSKSGLFAHFGSKEELELATIEEADRIFGASVVSRVEEAPPGLARLRTVVDAFFDHVRSEVFPGGCFFAAVAAGVAARPGRARDRVMGCLASWAALLGKCFQEAQDRGELAADADRGQLEFEVRAMLQAGNQSFVLTRDPASFARARAGVEEIIRRAAPPAVGPRAATDLRSAPRSPGLAEGRA
jgi:AcrR family transcriptional regulator